MINLNKGVVRGLLEVFGWGLWQLYNLLQRLMKQAAPYYATGEWLDLHANGVDLTSRAATKATGRVRFLRGSSGTGNIVIPVGRIVRTKPDGAGEIYRYSTTAQGVLPAGAESVEIPVESESYGAGANATAGQICELATPVAGIAGVTNATDWLTSEGADAETDTQLQERYRLQWAGNNGCTKYAYQAWVQIATDAEFVGIVFDTGESYTASTSVPVTVELERNRQHFVRATYTGNAFNAGNPRYGFDIPIGALTSQWLANLYLDSLDHYIKDDLGIQYYLRYMDDFVVIGPSKLWCRTVLEQVEKYLTCALHLRLNPKTGIWPVTHGLDFVGYRHWSDHVLPRKRTVKRARAQFKDMKQLYAKGRIDLEYVRPRVASFTGYMQHCDGYRSLEYMLDDFVLIKP